MIETLITLFLAFNLSVETGHAAYYSHGVMRRVIAMRQSGNTAMPLPSPLPAGIVGFVAVED